MAFAYISGLRDYNKSSQLDRNVGFGRKSRSDRVVVVLHPPQRKYKDTVSPTLGGAGVMVTGVYHDPKTCAHNAPTLGRRGNRVRTLHTSPGTIDQPPNTPHSKRSTDVEKYQILLLIVGMGTLDVNAENNIVKTNRAVSARTHCCGSGRSHSRKFSQVTPSWSRFA